MPFLSDLLTIEIDYKPDRRCPVSLTVVTSIHPLSLDYNTGKQRANACRLISGGKLRRRRSRSVDGSMMIFVAVLIARTVDGGGGVPIRAPTKMRSAERAREKKQRFMCVRASQRGESSWRVR